MIFSLLTSLFSKGEKKERKSTLIDMVKNLDDYIYTLSVDNGEITLKAKKKEGEKNERINTDH